MKQQKVLYKSKDFIVKPSLIPNAGYGLFAARDFEKGEILGDYEGKLITEEEGERLEEKGVDCSHMLDITGLEVKGYAYIHPDKKMLLGYINHSPATVDRKRVSGKKAFNVEFLEKKTSPYIQIQAVKRIEAGDEIYLNYGSYFTRLYVSTEKAKNFYRN